MLDAHRIRAQERDAALATVINSFRTDPQLRWYFPDDGHYEKSAAVFFGVLLDSRVAGGEVWVTDQAAAVAMWVPPGGNLIGPEVASARYCEVVARLPAPAPERISAVDDAVDALLPRRAHWYLGVLACRPDRQRQGLGSAVSSPVLKAADRAGLPVALETSTAGNVEFYIRRGFAVLGTHQMGGRGSPVVRVMLREPSALV